jgi:guanine nucleotide-binding protein subunit beta-like protein 1
MAILPPDPVFSLRNLEMGPVNTIAFHSSERLFAGTQKGLVYLWDLHVSFLNDSVCYLKIFD